MNVLIAAIGTLLQLIGLILFKYWGWLVVAAIFGFMWLQNRRRVEWVGATDNLLLLVEIPRDNDKKELSAEQMFASLHGILRPKADLVREGSLQEHISFEIASINNQIQFFVWVPKHLKDFVEGQIYAQYPRAHIKEGVDDYVKSDLGERILMGTELVLTKPDVVPIKTFTSFEVDPLAGISAVLAKLEDVGEEMWIQVLARPIDDAWQDIGNKYISDVKNGKSPGIGTAIIDTFLQLPVYFIENFFKAIWAPPESKDAGKGDKKELSTGQATVIKAVEEKINKLGYAVKIRIAYLGPNEELGKQRIQAIVGAFKQYNTTNLNGFKNTKTVDAPEFMEDYRARLFLDKGFILNIEELASLYHLPHTSVETPNMVWTTAKTSEPPSNLPSEATTEGDEVSLFGVTNFRGGKIKFGIKRADRGRHLYIVGQTGAGKSGLLQLLTLSDIYHNQGFAIIDPHGDYAQDIMKYIPEHRLADVVYFNPADRDFPIGFNPLEVLDEGSKHHISSELVGVLKRMFDSWGPRLEYILRYTILALLDYPDATMLGINRMLTEKPFRNAVIKEIKDPVVKNFWVTEFASWNDKFANEAVAPVLNKVGAFTANPLIRNVIGQPKTNLNLRKIMDEGKILIVNLSRGRIGEDNAAVLGAMMVTKLQLAAMSRADMKLEDRRPFYLYVDEFQNFATDSFAVILSEARKYGLNLTVANQYISQMPETVRDAVFGNVGSMISFRVGAEDSTPLSKYFEPAFEPADLTKLNNRNVFISMIIDGEKNIPFSATTLMLPEAQHDHTEEMIALSRQKYAKGREEVEAAISEATLGAGNTVDSLVEQKPNMLGELKNPGASREFVSRPPRPVDNRGQGSNRSGQDRRSGSSGDRRPQGSGGQNRSQSSAPRTTEQTRTGTGAQPEQTNTPKQPQSSEVGAGQEISLRK